MSVIISISPMVTKLLMNNMYILIIVIILFLLVVLLKAIFENKELSEKKLEYNTVASLMNKTEKEFFRILSNTVQDQYYIFSKVRLLDIFTIQKGLTRSHRQILKNYIQSKHVDFLLCDKVTMKPIIAIELDGKSHLSYKRKERDELVNRIFESANMQLIHVPVASEYNITAILQLPILQEEISKFKK